MGLKARLSSYYTKQANNGVNLVTSRKINTRLARPIDEDSRTARAARLCDFFSSKRAVWGASVAKVFTINEEFTYLTGNRDNLSIRLNTI